MQSSICKTKKHKLSVDQMIYFGRANTTKTQMFGVVLYLVVVAQRSSASREFADWQQLISA